ncbi:hypothetical protein EMCRGX_G011104 [Ephydatia muelleri]
MEPGKDSSAGSGSLEVLKRYFTDAPGAQSGKHLTNAEVCAALVDLADSASSVTPRHSAIISSAVEIMVHACSSSESDIRLSATENLRRLIKGLMATQLSRLQQDLFHELKKNGSSRSLCTALDCFASLYPLTRASKVITYAQNLLPVFERLVARDDEAVIDSLQDVFGRMLPGMAPFIAYSRLQLFIEKLLEKLPGGLIVYQRMVAVAIVHLCANFTQPAALTNWMLKRLLEMGCVRDALDSQVHGVLLCLQQMMAQITTTTPSDTMLKKVYCYLMACLVHRGLALLVPTLEALVQLLGNAPLDLAHWMASPLAIGSAPHNLWKQDYKSPTEEQPGEEEPLFADDDVGTGGVGGDSEGAKMLASDSSEEMLSLGVRGPGIAKRITKANQVLSNAKVSVQSLGLAALAAVVSIRPTALVDLSSVRSFASASDPKLRGNAVKLAASLVSAELRRARGEVSACRPLIEEACELIGGMTRDDTPVVLKALCEALQVCLPTMTSSSSPKKAIALLRSVLPLSASPYWLTKVELLQTLSPLEFTSLSAVDPALPRTVLHGIVLPLLSDSDHRVRGAACEALVRLVPRLKLTSRRELAHARRESARVFSHLLPSHAQLTMAGIQDTKSKHRPEHPLCLDEVLDHLVNHLSSSLDQTLQKGCLEALHSLVSHYPPATLPWAWGCEGARGKRTCTALQLSLSLLTGSKLGWSIQGHIELLNLSSDLFLACALSSLDQGVRGGGAWSALCSPVLASHASCLLVHCAKLLTVFVHIMEGKDPDVHAPRRVLPRSKAMENMTQKIKGGISLGGDTPTKPSLSKDGLGTFNQQSSYNNIYEACKSAYTNYQVSLQLVGEDKFSQLLLAVHTTLAGVLEFALASDVGKHVEELLGLLAVSVRVDPSGSLLCVQQLLNALFGMNTAGQHTPLFSPYITSLPYTPYTSGLPAAPPVQTNTTSIFDCAVMEPQRLLMTSWLCAHQLSSEQELGSVKSVGATAATKPLNPVSAVKDYLGYFEPLVVDAMNQFSYTSSVLLQQRVLFFLVQLLHLKVRYTLLDLDRRFLEAVLKLTTVMESRAMRGAEQIVPHLFQFLVLLANDSSKLTTIPQVIQKCDAVMASGHSVTTFAIPALQPLVLNLFVRPGSQSAPDLDTQRDVVVNMLLRLVEHGEVISLLTFVLDCYRPNPKLWNRASAQIYAALLPHIGKLQVVLDTPDALTSLYQLFAAIDPEVINLETLFAALMKQQVVTSLRALSRWLALLCTVLALLVTRFEEAVFVSSVENPVASPEAPCQDLATFLIGTLHLASSAVLNIVSHTCALDDCQLPTLLATLLLLIQALLRKPYNRLRADLVRLSTGRSLLHTTFIQLSSTHPLLTLHYISTWLGVGPLQTQWIADLLTSPEPTCVGSSLLQHSTLLLVAHHARDQLLSNALCRSSLLHRHAHTDVVQKFLTRIGDSRDLTSLLIATIKTSVSHGQTTPTEDLCSVAILHQLTSEESLDLLCSHYCLLPLPSIGRAAGQAACGVLRALGSIEPQLAQRLLNSVRPYKARLPQLVAVLEQLSGAPIPLPIVSHKEMPYVTPTQDWYLAMIRDYLADPACSGLAFARLLEPLPLKDTLALLQGEVPAAILDHCLAHGIDLTLGRSERHPSEKVVPAPLHPVLEGSAAALLGLLQRDMTQERAAGVCRPLARFLAAQHQFSAFLSFDEKACAAILNTALLSLQGCVSLLPRYEAGRLVTALDCCTLALQVVKVVSMEWSTAVVAALCRLVPKVYDHKLKVEPVTSDQDAARCLGRLFTDLLPSTLIPSPPSLNLSIFSLICTLSRLPHLTTHMLMPPALMTGAQDYVNPKMLDQSLSESQVLLQYVQRCNLIGWLNKAQFEERWMQLLGVLNAPPPPEGIVVEELNAYVQSLSHGMEAVTTLLLSTSLTPNPGNPICGAPLHTHRNQDINFLGSSPGTKLSSLRLVIEREMITRCGEYSTLQGRYQIPHRGLSITAHHPPLFARNLERPLGSTKMGPSQLSLHSLLPVMLHSETNIGKRTSVSSRRSDVDIDSCVISVQDLIAHWLTQPVHTLVLAQALRMVLMISDLFSLPSQFEWMLLTFLGVAENHPAEDVGCQALLVLGILKSAAVVQTIANPSKICDVVEKALESDSVLIQNAALYGVLYLAENHTSPLQQNIGTIVVKFVLSHLQDFSRHQESHIRLLWSVACSLLTHSRNLKDANLSTKLLEAVLPILSHPHTSSQLYQCVILGLEHLLLNFSVRATDRSVVCTTATAVFNRAEQGKSLPSLALLLTSMYTGEEADFVSGLAAMDSDTNVLDIIIQAREHINCILEKLRTGSEDSVGPLAEIFPQLMVDFLPKTETLNSVLTEFISVQQTRPAVAVTIMGKTFQLLMQKSEQATITDWVILSLESFLQQEPEERALWTVTALLLASSTNEILRNLLTLLAHWRTIPRDKLLCLLSTAAHYFHSNQCLQPEHGEPVLKLFMNSKYASLRTLFT